MASLLIRLRDDSLTSCLVRSLAVCVVGLALVWQLSGTNDRPHQRSTEAPTAASVMAEASNQ